MTLWGSIVYLILLDFYSPFIMEPMLPNTSRGLKPKRRKYGCKHLPMKELIAMRKSNMTKDEWLFRHSNINPLNLEQPPCVEIYEPIQPNLEQPPNSVEIYMPDDIEVGDEITTSKGSQQRSKGKIKGTSRRSRNPYKQKSLSQQGVSYEKNVCLA